MTSTGTLAEMIEVEQLELNGCPEWNASIISKSFNPDPMPHFKKISESLLLLPEA